VVRFFLETGIVPSLLGFEAKEHALPKEESMPVVSVLEQLFYHLPFTHYSVWHPAEGQYILYQDSSDRFMEKILSNVDQEVFVPDPTIW